MDTGALVPALQQLTVALQSLVQVLQSMAAVGSGPASVTQSTAGAAVTQSPDQCGPGSGCEGAGMAAAAPTMLQQAAPAAIQAPAPVPSPAPAPPVQSGPLVSGPQQHSKQENALVVADVARQLGVDPVLAVATMLVESNGDNTNRTGDGGTSFGLFQLHIGGHLPKDWNPGEAGHDNVYDPRKNAQISLERFAANQGKFSGPELAFQSQRPADHDGYVAAIEKRMDEARQLLGM